jgi:hypothetical protein
MVVIAGGGLAVWDAVPASAEQSRRRGQGDPEAPDSRQERRRPRLDERARHDDVWEWGRPDLNGDVAEREGFEPSMQVTPHGGLANRCTRPLCDLSVGRAEACYHAFRPRPTRAGRAARGHRVTIQERGRTVWADRPTIRSPGDHSGTWAGRSGFVGSPGDHCGPWTEGSSRPTDVTVTW